jgi:hypothetical protein
MRLFRNFLSISLLVAPSLLRADATIRYKTDMTSAMPLAGLSDSDSTIYMKGTKGVSVAGGQTTIADFARQEITIIDNDRKKYATIPAADYGARLSESMPQMGAAAPTMETKCDTSKSGRTEVIQGVQAEEREQTCSVQIKMPGSKPEVAAAMAGMNMKFVTHIWSGAPGERARVPALWQLSGYELWQKYFMNPIAAMGKAMGGMAPMAEDLQKDSSAILRLNMEMYMNAPSMAGMTGTTGVPMMKMNQEVVELSTAPLDDSLFQIPADCTSTTFGDLMNGVLQARMQAMKTPKAQSTQPAPAIPATIKAYVPELTPVTRTEHATTANSAQGMVDVLVTVGPKGNVEDAEPLSGPESLRKVAVDTVKRWTFRPVIRDGAPVAALTTASVFFSGPGKFDAAAFQNPDAAKAVERKAQLEQAMPRSPQQVLVDLEQDAGGVDKSRRENMLSKLAKAALTADSDDKAVAYANEMLAAAQQDKKGWNYGNAIHDGHAALGLVALRKNDIGSARNELLEAGKTPGSPQLDSFGPDMTLANELLKKGERDVVIEYFGLCRSFWKLGTSQLDAWTATVRRGETPIFLTNLR